MEAYHFFLGWRVLSELLSRARLPTAPCLSAFRGRILVPVAEVVLCLPPRRASGFGDGSPRQWWT